MRYAVTTLWKQWDKERIKPILLGFAWSLLVISLSGCESPSTPSFRETDYPLRAATHSGHASLPAPGREEALDHSLAGYLAYAALHNPGLEAAFHQWIAAAERVDQAAALPDPRFSYAYFIDEVETRVGPQEQRFSLSQTFPWVGKLDGRSDVASQAALVAREEYNRKKLELFNQVKKAYFEYYFLGQSLSILQENLILLKHLEQVARTRYAAGGSTQAAVLKAQIEVETLTNRLESLMDLRDPLCARLSSALNRPQEILPWPATLPACDLETGDEEILAWVLQDNPELKAGEYRVLQETASRDLAGRGYYPDITLGVDYIDTGRADMPGVRDSGKDPWAATLSLNLPLWFDKLSAGEREADARIRAASRDRIDRSNRLNAEAKLALYRFRDGQRRVALYEKDLIPKARQTLEVSEKGFSGGKLDFFDLIDAQKTLLEFRLAYERARTDCAVSLAEVERLSGHALLGLDGPGPAGETNENPEE